jgi:hypothetical protein
MNEESTLNTPSYPYWIHEFNKEFDSKHFDVWYRERGWGDKSDIADGYRVYMILCNHNYAKTRMDVLNMLKSATEENPIEYQGEFFWTEPK